MPQFTVRLPNGVVKTYPDLPTEQLAAELEKDIAAAQGPPDVGVQALRRAQTDVPSNEPSGLAKFLEGATLAASFIPQSRALMAGAKGVMMIPRLRSFFQGLAGAAPRIAAVSGLGAGAEAAAGGDPLARGGFEAALEALPAGLGRAIPSAGYRGALVTGGVRDPHLVDRGVEAFLRERDISRATPLTRSLPVGAQRRTLNRREGLGKQIGETIEKADKSDAGVSLGDYAQGSARALDVIKESAEFPETLGRRVLARDRQHLMEQLADALGTNTADLERQIDQIARQRRVHPDTAFQEMLGGTHIGVGRAQKLQQGLGEIGEDVTQARINREYTSPALKATGVINADRAELLRRLQEQAVPELAPLRQRFSDVRTMENINRQLRGEGTVLGAPGQAGVRGGLGYSAGRGLSLVTGGGQAIPTGLGLLSSLAAPYGISAGANLMGGGIEKVPAVTRIIQYLLSLGDEPERSEPGGPPRQRTPGR